MKKVKLGNHSLEIYDSIDELPMKRFHKFNKMMLVDSGVGSSLSDADAHLERIKAFIRVKKADEAMKEVDNLRTNLYFVISSISPKNLAFASLVKSLDGTECNDLSDDGLQDVVDKLGDVTVTELNEEFDSVKKKIESDLLQYFPQMFDDSSAKEYFDLLRRRTLSVLDGIISGKADENEIERITTELLVYSKPYLFSGAESAEVQFDKQFDKMCHIISYHLNVSPKDYTVTEYYSAFDYIKEIIKAKKAAYKIK